MQEIIKIDISELKFDNDAERSHIIELYAEAFL